MCGIAGIVDFRQNVQPEVAIAMADLLKHRGPDDEGTFQASGVALAHRRLAIIDLSRAGRQPMADESGRCRLIYNGEIYNYRELRVELERRGHRFRTRTDSEVILAAYVEWGAGCVQRFIGMWAFGLWDEEKRRLFCSRDRFGIKPFYYRHHGSRLAFASELKAFRAEGSPLAPNPRVIRAYLEHALVDHTNETFFSGIMQLPPAHSMTFSDTGLTLSRYWSLGPDDKNLDAPDEVRELFLDAVRLELRSDVPVGTCLSGGIDSSAIACAVDHLLRTEAESARPIGERQRTFTAFFAEPGLDERPFARAVVDLTGADAHWISFSDADLINDLPEIVEMHDEPFRSTSMIAQWYVMQAARESGLKVMLDGQGADELLAGYESFFPFFFADLLSRRQWRAFRREVDAYRRVWGASWVRTLAGIARPFLPAPLAWHARSRLNGSTSVLHRSLRSQPVALPTGPRTFPDRLRSQLHLVLDRRLPELLHAEDRNSMAHSLEARVPFLDHRLVELMFTLAPHHVIEDGLNKMVLRRALRDLLPASVANRSNKIGFATPESRWMRGKLGELAADVFQTRAFVDREFVDAKTLRNRLTQHRDGKVNAGSELWRALNLGLWILTFLDGPDPSPDLRRFRI